MYDVSERRWEKGTKGGRSGERRGGGGLRGGWLLDGVWERRENRGVIGAQLA
jgi:hypothetical protein